MREDFTKEYSPERRLSNRKAKDKGKGLRKKGERRRRVEGRGVKGAKVHEGLRVKREA